jgi:hypothetical protein
MLAVSVCGVGWLLACQTVACAQVRHCQGACRVVIVIYNRPIVGQASCGVVDRWKSV